MKELRKTPVPNNQIDQLKIRQGGLKVEQSMKMQDILFITPEHFFTDEEINQFNSLTKGKSSDEIAKVIGIHRLKCGVRIYRILKSLINICDDIHQSKSIIKGKLKSIAIKNRKIYEGKINENSKEIFIKAVSSVFQIPDKQLEKIFIKEILTAFRTRQSEKIFSKPILSYFQIPDRQSEKIFIEEILTAFHNIERQKIFSEEILTAFHIPDRLRKLKWLHHEKSFNKSYELYILIWYLANNLWEKFPKRAAPPYTLIGQFLEEQKIKTYAVEKGVSDNQEALKAKDVKRYYLKTQEKETKKELIEAYNIIKDIYFAPITLPTLCSYLNISKLDAALEIDQQLRIFVDDPPDNNDELDYCLLFPDLEKVIPSLSPISSLSATGN